MTEVELAAARDPRLGAVDFVFRCSRRYICLGVKSTYDSPDFVLPSYLATISSLISQYKVFGSGLRWFKKEVCGQQQ